MPGVDIQGLHTECHLRFIVPLICPVLQSDTIFSISVLIRTTEFQSWRWASVYTDRYILVSIRILGKWGGTDSDDLEILQTETIAGALLVVGEMANAGVLSYLVRRNLKRDAVISVVIQIWCQSQFCDKWWLTEEKMFSHSGFICPTHLFRSLQKIIKNKVKTKNKLTLQLTQLIFVSCWKIHAPPGILAWYPPPPPPQV